MKFGLGLPHTGKLASPRFVTQFAVEAERLGFGALWAVDHLVMPEQVDSMYTLGPSPSPIAPGAVSRQLAPNYEMHTSLTFVAAVTTSIKLGTAVSVLPIRNPVLNARQLATLDIYSGGRVIYGAGVGWLREEAVAMGMPWDRRGDRAEEHIALMRALWCAPGDRVEFHGRYHQLPLMDPEPRPVQRPIPILIGGHSDTALERAGRIGDGWIATTMSPSRLGEHWAKVRTSCERAGRDPDALLLRASASRAAETPETELYAEYSAAGVDWLTVNVWRDSEGATLDEMQRIAEEVLPSFG
jgi:probable F420-dependent oxidoreductase